MSASDRTAGTPTGRMQVGRAWRETAVAIVGLGALAGAVSGWPAAAGAAGGGLTALLSHAWMARVLERILLRPHAPGLGRTVLLSVFRFAVVAILLAVLLGVARLPAGWVIAGLSIAPVALVVESLRKASGSSEPEQGALSRVA